MKQDKRLQSRKFLIGVIAMGVLAGMACIEIFLGKPIPAWLPGAILKIVGLYCAANLLVKGAAKTTELIKKKLANHKPVTPTTPAPRKTRQKRKERSNGKAQ